MKEDDTLIPAILNIRLPLTGNYGELYNARVGSSTFTLRIERTT